MIYSRNVTVFAFVLLIFYILLNRQRVLDIVANDTEKIINIGFDAVISLKELMIAVSRQFTL